VAREIREDGGMESDPVDTPECERVRRDLHRGVLAALLFELTEQAEKLERFGCGVGSLQHSPGEMVLDGADEGSDATIGPQSGVDQERGRRLTVRSGDSGDADPFIGSVIKIAGG